MSHNETLFPSPSLLDDSPIIYTHEHQAGEDDFDSHSKYATCTHYTNSKIDKICTNINDENGAIFLPVHAEFFEVIKIALMYLVMKKGLM